MDFTVKNAGYISISNTTYAHSVWDAVFQDYAKIEMDSTATYTLTAVHAVSGHEGLGPVRRTERHAGPARALRRRYQQQHSLQGGPDRRWHTPSKRRSVATA